MRSEYMLITLFCKYICASFASVTSPTGQYKYSNFPFFESINFASNEALTQGLELPAMDSRGRIPTMNDSGFCFTVVDPVSEDFLRYISLPENQNKVILEIGGGYGLLAELAINKGVKHYILNDMEVRHLRVFARNFYLKNQSYQLDELLSNVKLFEGRFPDDFPDDFPQVDVGIMNKVFHFLKPREIDFAMSKLNRITRMGGIWFVFVVSPYASPYERFAVVYESNKRRGYPFPGYCVDAKVYCSDAKRNTHVPGLPQTLWFFEQTELHQLFTQYGFVVEREWDLDLPTASDKHWRPGRDMVGIRVRKIKEMSALPA